jgi:CheY-like chemotaxis protein
VARRLRQCPNFKQTLIVAMTGWGQEEDRRRSREAGFDHHLVKPAQAEALQQLLSQPAA